MHWDDLKYFLALSREGSLSATARSLKIEHTTVARRVSNLEQALEIKLFDRLARGWTLTAEGQELYARVCLIEEEMQALQRIALGQSTLAGRVRVSVPPLLLSHFVLPHLDAFHEAYPQIELELIGERRGANLGRGEADIALRLSEPQEPELVARTLGHIRYGLYGTKKMCALPNDEQRFIGFDDSIAELPQKLWLDNYLHNHICINNVSVSSAGKHQGNRSYTTRSNDMMIMCQAAAQGWGIALLPKFLAATDDRLQSLNVMDTPLTLPVYLVMHADVRLAPRIRATADCFINMFSEFLDEL